MPPPLVPASEAALPSPEAVEHARPDADLRQQGLRRLRTTLLPYCVGMAAALATAAAGHAQMWQAWLLVAYTATGLAAFYALIASGATRHWRDPMLVFPQVVFGIGLVGLSYAVMEVARGVALQWLCLIIVFDMRRLTARQTFIAACLAMALPAIGWLATWEALGQHGRLATQLLFLALGAAMVPVLLIEASFARKLQTRRMRQRKQMDEVLAQMRNLSVRDGLSGLHNRRYMQDCLDEEARRQKRTGRPASVAILDIDLFKRVNDQFGHAVGDQVIKAFAALGNAAFGRETDVLARWGGEEFLLLLPEASPGQALARLHHLRELVHAYDWSVHHPGLKVTFSAGVCELVPGRSVQQALDQADEALYRAKAGGRDRVEPASPADEGVPAVGEPAAVAHALDKARGILAARAVADPATAEPATAKAEKKGEGRRLSPVTRLLLGSDSALHAPLRACLVASCNYAVHAAAVIYGMAQQIISRELGLFFLAVMAVGAIAPYALVRSGATARLADRFLTLPQMYWSAMMMAVLYATVPEGRAYALQIMCVVLVFSLVDSRSRQAVFIGAGFIAALALGYLYLLYAQPAGFSPTREGLSAVASAFVLALLTAQSRSFALAREQSAEEKKKLADATRQVFELMTHDPLTGIFNRQYLQGLLERECARHAQAGHAFSVALLDLDHFKRINDTHGHTTGDEVLVGFAQAAKSFVRETDTVGRWGGEEFLVVLPETESGPNGLRAADRLREHVCAKRLSPSVPELAVSFSAGVATHLPGESVDALLERADQALYRAKEGGRNACMLASEAPEHDQAMHAATTPG